MAQITEYTNLGNSGLKTSKLILGCMNYGKENKTFPWTITDEEEVFAIMKKLYDAGIRTFDTADIYSFGSSEEILGKFIKKYDIPRETLVILTKCYFPVIENLDDYFNLSPTDPKVANRFGLSRKHIFDAVDQSVKRLGTYIDVLQIHRYDTTTPDEEVMRALNDVVNSGKVRYIGASSMKAYQFIGLQEVAEKHGWHKFISMQNLYNLLYREEEREMIAYCKKTNVGVIPWSPIAAGVLARPRSSDGTVRSQAMSFITQFFLKGANASIIDRVEEIAKKRNVSMAVISTAWVLYKGHQPIIGVSSIKRLDDALSLLDFELTGDEIKYLEESYQPVPVFGIV